MCLPELEVPKIAQACDTLVLWKSKIALKQIINELSISIMCKSCQDTQKGLGNVGIRISAELSEF